MTRNDDISRLSQVFRKSRYLVGGLLLILAGLAFWDPGNRLDGFLPALSPFAAMVTAIGGRMLPPFLLLCIPILLLSIFRRRWFCSHACPTGVLLEIAGRLRKRRAGSGRSRFPRVSRWVLFLALGGALAGYPLFVWLDPLSLLNATFMAMRRPMTILSIAPAAGLLLLVAISVWRPYLWCARICPLGASQELLRDIASIQRRTTAAHPVVKDRRIFLGLLAGGALGGLARYLPGTSRVIRPPGAVPENRFTGLCARCGTCIAACPERIIHADPGVSGITGLMTPAITIANGYCSETCNECGTSCPTSAISHHSLADKHNIAIGLAEVIKPLCLSWENHEFCMKCADFCPYNAVRGVDMHNVKCPEVVEEKCRGCGACEYVCPTQRPAIVVKSKPQEQLASVKVTVVRDVIFSLGL